MTAPQPQHLPVKLLRTPSDMVDAFRARVRQLNTTYATIDAISGLPDGYTSKLMAPKPMRGLGEKAIEGLCGGTALAFVAVEDKEQLALIKSRLKPRKRAIDKKVASALMLKPQAMPITTEQLAKREQLKMWGSMGGKASAKRRMKTMKKRTRQRIASHAARMRWRNRDA